MTRLPGVRWSLAGLIAVLLFIYGAVWHPFAPFSSTLRSGFSALALFVTAMAVTVVKTTHKSPAV
jgi:hypothetical protein